MNHSKPIKKLLWHKTTIIDLTRQDIEAILARELIITTDQNTFTAVTDGGIRIENEKIYPHKLGEIPA